MTKINTDPNYIPEPIYTDEERATIAALAKQAPSPAPSAPNSPVTNEIDAMVAQQSPRAVAMPNLAGQTTQNLRLDNEGNIEVLGKLADLAPLSVPANYSAAEEVHQLANEVNRISAELAEGVFNSRGERTGDKYSGRDRTVREAQLASLQGSLDFAMHRGLQLADAAGANNTARERELAEQAAVAAFHGGDPAKAALLKQAIEAEEARRVAEAIVRNRGR